MYYKLYFLDFVVFLFLLPEEQYFSSKPAKKLFISAFLSPCRFAIMAAKSPPLLIPISFAAFSASKPSSFACRVNSRIHISNIYNISFDYYLFCLIGPFVRTQLFLSRLVRPSRGSIDRCRYSAPGHRNSWYIPIIF